MFRSRPWDLMDTKWTRIELESLFTKTDQIKVFTWTWPWSHISWWYWLGSFCWTSLEQHLSFGELNKLRVFNICQKEIKTKLNECCIVSGTCAFMENICQKLNYGFQDFFFLNLQVRILILTELFRKLIELKSIDHWLTMLTVSTLSPMTKLLPNVDRCELIQQLRKSLSRWWAGHKYVEDSWKEQGCRLFQKSTYLRY